MNIDLSQLFSKYAALFRNEFNSRIQKRLNFDGQSYSSLKPVKNSGIKKGRSLNSRLNNTGKYSQQAFVASSTDSSMTISPNRSQYGKGVTYEDITAYNDANSPNRNSNILNPPRIFPQGGQALQELEQMQLYSAFMDDITKVVDEQLGSETTIHSTTIEL
jgi:hypothetical protein